MPFSHLASSSLFHVLLEWRSRRWRLRKRDRKLGASLAMWCLLETWAFFRSPPLFQGIRAHRSLSSYLSPHSPRISSICSLCYSHTSRERQWLRESSSKDKMREENNEIPERSPRVRNDLFLVMRESSEWEWERWRRKESMVWKEV